MDSLDEFERQLAAEKAEREKGPDATKHRRHHHGRQGDDDEGTKHSTRRHHGHQDSHDEDSERHGHRSKRRRHWHERSHKHHDLKHRRSDQHDKSSEPKQDLPLVPSEQVVESSSGLKRDAWMTAPSALSVEYVESRRKETKPVPRPVQEAQRVIHARELNHGLVQDDDKQDESAADVSYTFGDAGSSWRMSKLGAVYSLAQEKGRPVDQVALERYGSLEAFDAAREEEAELERRTRHGADYQAKQKPTGELFGQRRRSSRAAEPDASPSLPSQETAAPHILDATALNRLRAQMIKAKLSGAANAAQLEQEYQAASASHAPEAVLLGAMHSRQLAGSSRPEAKPVTTRRGLERGQVEENDELSIKDMVGEERRTKGQVGGEGARLAQRIARDGRFQDNLEYMDDEAAKLARHVERNDAALGSRAVADLHKMTAAIDHCALCHHADTGRAPLAPVVSLATRVYLTLAPAPEISPGSAVIVPLAHHANLLACDDDEWEEMRNFMKSLTRMYHAQGRDVVFYEDAAFPPRHAHRRHASLYAVPIPYDEGALAPAHFRQAFLSAGDEWSQHAKVIDTRTPSAPSGGSAGALRRSVAREAPYFHVWFDLDGGLAHIVDDADRWPRHDGFARGVVGGIVDAEAHIVKKRARWSRDADESARVQEWKARWRKFDWTRLLVGD
ncbi:hypothetical protein CDD81_2068 [Ophiocordyceps australis]|uniref:Cytochrome c domain-containing protein n=1 Tax=Ophiocordyceps australis TaxID=1399860 RepID=A0A2C5XYE9_9HYPO|nr:hypothetical protein CDD81_2068 [Ophiocordyceps australis]